jgi:magnesium-transporting ATPase (P-type)
MKFMGFSMSIIILVILVISRLIYYLSVGPTYNASEYMSYDFISIFHIALILVIATLPDCLSLIMTIINTFTSMKFLENNCLSTTFSAVENLGRTNAICTDINRVMIKETSKLVSIWNMQSVII